jgi:hypothetical protein
VPNHLVTPGREVDLLLPRARDQEPASPRIAALATGRSRHRPRIDAAVRALALPTTPALKTVRRAGGLEQVFCLSKETPLVKPGQGRPGVLIV